MSGNGLYDDERMLQLLADRATQGLERAEAVALDAWLARAPDFVADAFERAAAVVSLTSTSVYEEVLPMSLLGRLLADAEAFFASSDRV